jgi:hypothetical protein
MQMTTVEEHIELTQETRFQVVLLTDLLPKTKANYEDVKPPCSHCKCLDDYQAMAST